MRTHLGGYILTETWTEFKGILRLLLPKHFTMLSLFVCSVSVSVSSYNGKNMA